MPFPIGNHAIINKLQKFLLIFILVHENFSFVKDQLVKEANLKFCFDHFAGERLGRVSDDGGGGGVITVITLLL